MKLTEAKLKQMILETMQRSANYEKLKTLMVSSAGYLQAESLYEMIRGTFDEEEQMHMDIFFKPLILARERKAAEERYQAAYKNFKYQEETFQYYGDGNYDDMHKASREYDDMHKAFMEMDAAEEAKKEKDKEWGDSYIAMGSHIRENPSESPLESLDDFRRVVMEACHKVIYGSELGEYFQ